MVKELILTVVLIFVAILFDTCLRNLKTAFHENKTTKALLYFSLFILLMVVFFFIVKELFSFTYAIFITIFAVILSLFSKPKEPKKGSETEKYKGD